MSVTVNNGVKWVGKGLNISATSEPSCLPNAFKWPECSKEISKQTNHCFQLYVLESADCLIPRFVEYLYLPLPNSPSLSLSLSSLPSLPLYNYNCKDCITDSMYSVLPSFFSDPSHDHCPATSTAVGCTWTACYLHCHCHGCRPHVPVAEG